MTLDDMIKQYVHAAVEEYLRTRDNTNDISTEQIHNVISEYLCDHDYMTRDDVNDQINGATVYVDNISLSLSA